MGGRSGAAGSGALRQDAYQSEKPSTYAQGAIWPSISQIALCRSGRFFGVRAAGSGALGQDAHRHERISECAVGSRTVPYAMDGMAGMDPGHSVAWMPRPAGSGPA